ncbi:enoyl-CoA hydratase/isomerase family protein [Algicella marina]|uniref:Enoyl-CoA hydratase/isomerase family protein n=1 Tax=Algicella marina TaxID=2683284 RepID=A0A6P1T3V4_9RHOB|nr:enoyl-CoA hydratase-related protein [Algicella marina]QHQ36390.1 enoyl-CoA hydratase/isomerase family protein [Algicella marina]
MIDTRQEGLVGWIVLNDPERHNALTRAAMSAVAEALEAHRAAGCRAVVLTGRGRSFSAGASLKEVGSEDWTENPLTTLASTIEACPLPVVAALNGGTYGGAVDIALACDFRLGAEGMRLTVPAARLGIHYPAEGLARAARLFGLQVARRIFLAAESFPAESLLTLGLVESLHPVEELEQAAGDFADHLAALAPLAVQGMKQTLRETLDGSADAGRVRGRIAECFASDDHREGLAAQKEKRAPEFRGR